MGWWERTTNWLQLFKRLTGRLPDPQTPVMVTLPPELVEEILHRITDNNTLLKCRLVCFQWKQLANDLLEKTRLTKLTTWNPDLDLNYTQFLSPAVSAVKQDKEDEMDDEDDDDDRIIHVVLPSSLKNLDIERNPFPHKSIAIVELTPSHFEDETSNPLPNDKSQNLLVEFFQHKGHFLTSLIFHDVGIEEKHLAQLLGFTSSLQILSFSQVTLFNELENTTNLNIPQQLTHLQIVNCCCEQLPSYILPLCFPQLLSLKIVDDYYIEFSTLEKENFANLNQLYIYNARLQDFIWVIQNIKYFPSLKYLTMTVPYGPHIVPKSESNDCRMNFFLAIATSLVHLRLNNSLEYLLNYLEMHGVTFPNMRVFESGHLNEELDVEYWKKMLLPWFPNLKSVIFIDKSHEKSKCLLFGLVIDPKINDYEIR